MEYQLVPYTAEWEAAAARFNVRLRRANAEIFLLPERAVPTPAAGPLQRQHWLVTDKQEVRGGCLLQTHQGWTGEQEAEVLNIQSPLSEGLAERRYAGVAPWMIRELLRSHPLAYSVGMGGEQMPYPRLLRALGWRIEPVPFYFRVLAGRCFLANMQALRRHPKLGWLTTIGRIPVLPDKAFALLHAARRKPATRPVVGELPAWSVIRSRYRFAIDRSPSMLDALYPPGDPHFRRFQIPGAAGILRRSAFQGHPYFGNLTVATLVEAFFQPGAERALLRAALKESRALEAGLLLTNQTAPEMPPALEAEGWLPYASNFLFGLSPTLTARIGGQPIYVNRGDGDGLLNL